MGGDGKASGIPLPAAVGRHLHTVRATDNRGWETNRRGGRWGKESGRLIMLLLLVLLMEHLLLCVVLGLLVVVMVVVVLLLLCVLAMLRGNKRSVMRRLA
jgi:Flp pilus assembly protein TadB